MVAMAAFVLSACQKNNDTAPISVARDGGGTGAIAQGQHAGLQLNAAIYTDSSNQQGFQEAIAGFADAIVPENYIGFVGARGEGNTGAFLGGRVALTGGSLGSNSQTQVNITSNSVLQIVIYDEFVGKTDDQGAVIPPIARFFQNSSGYVRGNYVYLKFADEFGFVEMEGQFDATHFYGEISYDNQRTETPNGTPAAGIMGNFSVEKCQFFVCN